MSRLSVILQSSIGKKLLMAVTGLGFIGFLGIHLTGMMTLYSGREMFIGYGAKLHLFGDFMITLVEWMLLISAPIHIGIGLTLFVQNRRARHASYAVNASAGGQTFASKTMPYTGLLILGFLLIHLANFRFAGNINGAADMYDAISASFKKVHNLIIYAPALVVVALHVKHGLWSAFQAIGIRSSGGIQALKRIGFVFSVIIIVGSGFIPIYFFLLP